MLYRLEGHRPAWLVLASLNGALLLVVYLVFLVAAMKYALHPDATAPGPEGSGTSVRRAAA
jgi:hypothetical protein